MTAELLSDLLIVCKVCLFHILDPFILSEIFHSVFPAKTKGRLQKKKKTFHKVCLTPGIIPSEFIINVSTICFH